jgi:hypothetical protein
MDEELLRLVREFVADPTKAPALRSLLQAEAGRVIEGMSDESFAAAAPYADEEFGRRLAAYEALVDGLARAASLVAYWSKTTDERLVPGVVARLANALERSNGQQPFLQLYLYPAVLVLYAAGLGAVIGLREEQLAGLLGSSTIREREQWKAVALVLSGPAAIDHRIGQRLPGLERHFTPASDHLIEVTRPWLEELEPDPAGFERSFDRWEYLLGLVMFDLTREGGRRGYAPVGRLSWEGRYGNGFETALGEEIASAGADWPLLRAGLFGRDPARLTESVAGWHEHISAVRSQQH